MSEALTSSILSELLPDAKRAPGFDRIRTEAEAFLAEKGIPSKRQEDWKYVNLKRLFVNGLAINAEDISDREESDLKLENSARSGLLNGLPQKEFPTIEGLSIYSAMERIPAELGSSGIHKVQELAALNTALFKDALVIHVPKGSKVETVLLIDHLVDLSENSIANSRVLLVMEDNASFKCVHHFRGENSSDSSLLNHVTEVFMGRNARLEMNIIQEVGSGNVVNTTEVECQRDSSFTSNTVQLGGKLLRNNVNVRLKGEHIGAQLNGFYMLNGKELFDNHTIMDHLEPHCQSNEIYRGILSGRSTGVFNGKVHVHPDAQKTNAFQQNNNILLSDDATMNSKPELEIYADDVKCSHGSTTGQLDGEAVFYMRSRGLSVSSATNLLLRAFADETLSAIGIGELRTWVDERINGKMGDGSE